MTVDIHELIASSRRRSRDQCEVLNRMVEYCPITETCIRQIAANDPDFQISSCSFSLGVGVIVEATFHYCHQNHYVEETVEYDQHRQRSGSARYTPAIPWHELRFPDTKPKRPNACEGCSSYHGKSYGGNMLVCGIHASGWDGDSCPDWTGEEPDWGERSEHWDE